MNKKTGCKNNTDAITKEALDAQKEKKKLLDVKLKEKQKDSHYMDVALPQTVLTNTGNF